MSWLRFHSSPDAKTGIKRKKGGIFRNRFVQSLLMPHTILRNIRDRNKPMTSGDSVKGFLGF